MATSHRLRHHAGALRVVEWRVTTSLGELGRGIRLWDGLEGFDERFAVEAVSSWSGVTHLTLTSR